MPTPVKAGGGKAAPPDKGSPKGNGRAAPRSKAASRSGYNFGTFTGVFTPSLLTILGLVLFLRLGFVTGNVGVGQMLVILAMSTGVSVLTTISLAAICPK